MLDEKAGDLPPPDAFWWEPSKRNDQQKIEKKKKKSLTYTTVAVYSVGSVANNDGLPPNAQSDR